MNSTVNTPLATGTHVMPRNRTAIKLKLEIAAALFVTGSVKPRRTAEYAAIIEKSNIHAVKSPASPVIEFPSPQLNAATRCANTYAADDTNTPSQNLVESAIAVCDTAHQNPKLVDSSSVRSPAIAVARS